MAHEDTTTTETTDWALLYEREQRDEDYGTYSSFDGVSTEYVDNPQILVEKINENDLETIILFPSANKCVSALHSCVVAPGNSKVMGVWERTDTPPSKRSLLPHQ
jgi:ethanolamine utilization protein EutP (predicted NTPase)